MNNKPLILISLSTAVLWWYGRDTTSSDVTAQGEDTAGIIDSVINPFLNVSYQASGFAGLGLGMQISLAGINAIKQREGFRAVPYKDIAGYWTVGYGHKMGVLESFDSVNDAQATKLLASDLTTAENGVNSLVKVALSQNQYDALVSFVYNVGVGAFKRSSMLSLLNAGSYQLAGLQFTKWVYAGNQVSNGLLQRRKGEANQFTLG